MTKQTKKEIKEGMIEFFGDMFWYLLAFGATIFAIYLGEGLFNGF